MPQTPEPTDKLDATAPDAPALAVATAEANGPEDDAFDWDAVDWRAHEALVRRLRQRIFKATQAGQWAKVRNLPKLMLRSRSNTLVSVRRVTQRNAGRKTAGIDGQVALTPAARAGLAVRAHREARAWQPVPVKRVLIPKAGGKQRPLGIPVIIDRCHQARVVNALEPEWEARFEPRSYGFRPGRSCQDAVEAIFHTLCGKRAKRLWALDADLAAALDRIDHDHLVGMLGDFPAREMIRQWLRAGVIENRRLAPTEQGTPQGGVISPLLLNVALHGMEQAAGVCYRTTGNAAGRTAAGSPALVRHADDLAALCHSRQQAEQVKARLAAWLTARGLGLNEDKTKIAPVAQGFDLLGLNVRRYGHKLLIKPSKAAVRRIRARLSAEARALRGANAAAAATTLNPIIRGWAAYYRSVASKKTLTTLDHHVWKLVYNWAIRSHRDKPKRWIISRCFGRLNESRSDQWVFGDRDSGAYLHRLAWTPIVRHQMVKGAASVDNPALADYWANRRRKSKPPLSNRTLRLLQAQDGRCPLCRDYLLYADHQPQSASEWEQWLRTTRMAIRKHHIDHWEPHGKTDDAKLHLVHAYCHRRHTAAQTVSTALLPACQP